MGVEHSAQPLICLFHCISDIAKVVSQHTLLDGAESPRQFLHFIALLLQELKDVLPSLSFRKNYTLLVPLFYFLKIHKLCTSASCIEERVGIVENGCTLGPKSHPSSRRPNLRLACPGIHGQAGLARSNTVSDTCVQYALPDQGPEGAGS